MAAPRPQYFENTLQPIPITKESLLHALAELRRAIRRGIQLIEGDCLVPDPADKNAFGTIFSGSLGIALMFLRLKNQTTYLVAEEDSLQADFQSLAIVRINPHMLALDLKPGRASPFGSATLGSVVMRVVAGIPVFSSIIPGETTDAVGKSDMELLHGAVQVALSQDPVVQHLGHAMGVDEILYGRTGLLWAILDIRKRTLEGSIRSALASVFEAVPKLVNVIIAAGKLGAEEYKKINGQAGALPLMWPWLDQYHSLGAMHGITGILTVLIACRPEELDETPSSDNLTLIAHTITAICKLCISHDGHLPMSMPPFPSSRSSPFVQICHGIPGLLILLAYARSRDSIIRTYWEPEWDEAILLGSEKLWEQGLLSKGGGLCHGIAGNAWPLLMLHNSLKYNNDNTTKGSKASRYITNSGPQQQQRLTGDQFLSRALAFLLHARETPPYKAQNLSSETQYRIPDNPYSLFEGLAGTVSAWAEACVAIVARLQKMEGDKSREDDSVEADEAVRNHLQNELGFPWLTI